VRNSRDVRESGAARPHTLAVELCIARHLRRHFLRRYLWGYVWRIWASSSESPTTVEPAIGKWYSGAAFRKFEFR
jgi:hypothetical protein